ncbi:hypothetical protein BX070DRAFT_251912 [Coemansia spiralis]|nr:hypothetical protein BX070DRAFT_251912 [Coemansia spiralis]
MDITSTLNMQTEQSSPDDILEEGEDCHRNGKPENSRMHSTPIRGKGMHTMLRKHGFQVYLLDENRTARICSACYDATALFWRPGRATGTGISRQCSTSDNTLTGLCENGEIPERLRCARPAARATDEQQPVKYRREAHKQE